MVYGHCEQHEVDSNELKPCPMNAADRKALVHKAWKACAEARELVLIHWDAGHVEGKLDIETFDDGKVVDRTRVRWSHVDTDDDGEASVAVVCAVADGIEIVHTCRMPEKNPMLADMRWSEAWVALSGGRSATVHVSGDMWLSHPDDAELKAWAEEL